MKQRTNRALALLLSLSTAFAATAIDTCAADDERRYSIGVTISSHGRKLPGIYYGAAGAGPHPTVILLHGYPGNEKNLDIAQGLRSAGWNVLFFHYRGAWGAEGDFSFLNAESDVASALRFLGEDGQAGELRVDRSSISLIGHSMGGHMAIAGIEQNSEVRCAVAYDPANISVTFAATEAEKSFWSETSDSLFMLSGWSAEKFRSEIEEHAARLDLTNRVEAIGGRPMLVVAADSEVIPIVQIDGLVDAIRASGANVTYKLLVDDHSFNNSRDKLLIMTLAFLRAHCTGENEVSREP